MLPNLLNYKKHHIIIISKINKVVVVFMFGVDRDTHFITYNLLFVLSFHHFTNLALFKLRNFGSIVCYKYIILKGLFNLHAIILAWLIQY